jgi:hypothetical protein
LLIERSRPLHRFTTARKNAVKKPFIKDWYWSAIGPEYTLKWASVDTGK